MKVIACVLLLCVGAVFGAGGYSDEPHGGYLDLKKPYQGCYYVGQYLRHPSDECKFLRCDYGNEPWKQNGKILLFAREMRCANGLSVGYGYTHGYDNPCNTPNKKCFVYSSYQEPHYQEPHYDTKAVYQSYEPATYEHPEPQGYEPVEYKEPSYEAPHNTGYTEDKHPHATEYKAPAHPRPAHPRGYRQQPKY